IVVREVNQAPVLAAIADVQWTLDEGESVVQAAATDADEPVNTIVYSLVDGPTNATIDTTGQIRWTPNPTDEGQSHRFVVRATDDGTPALFDDEEFFVAVESNCTFDSGLTGWTTTQSGGTLNQGSVISDDCQAVLTEGDSFVVELSRAFIVGDSTTVQFTYEGPEFDETAALEFVNDAFEVAVVDNDGNSLVSTFLSGRDAFFNVTEGLETFVGEGVSIEGKTVSVGLNDLPIGTAGTVVFRLVNNDSDTATTVRIVDFRLAESATPSEARSTVVAAVAATLPDDASFAAMPNRASQSEVMESAMQTVASAVTFGSPYSESTLNASRSLAAVEAVPPNLQLTDAGIERGFEVATFISGFLNLPLGVAFPDPSSVLVANYTTGIYYFDRVTDGLTIDDGILDSTLQGQTSHDLAVANGEIYLSSGNSLYALDTLGHVVRTVSDNLPAAHGVLASPEPDGEGIHHLFVASDAGVWDVNPATGDTFVRFESRFDGISTDGVILFGADLWAGQVVGISVETGAIEYEFTVPGGPDGTALGQGSLAGHLYVNTNFSGVWEIDLTTREMVQIAVGSDPNASRGDFVSIAPDGSLLVTQSTQIDRIIPPIGGSFGNSNVVVTASQSQNSFPIGTNVVISGEATSIDSVARRNVAIQQVTVNGVTADVLDASGHFFSAAEVHAGLNNFEIIAVDEYGRTGRTVLQFEGVAPDAIEFNQYADITGSFGPVYQRTSFNDQDALLHVDLETLNSGSFDADVPILVVVKNITDPSVSVLNADGLTPDGLPFFDFSPHIDNSRLPANAKSDAMTLSFSNPMKVRFGYELVYYGKLNQPPAITSVPRIEALAGREYQYAVDAFDPDADELAYRLEVKPDGMNIVNGTISWSPNSDDVGNHEVVVVVDDQRGGTADQRFTISVVDAPPNRPPIITSRPVTAAIAESAEYRYDVEATDADFDVLAYSLTQGPTGMEIASDTGIITWEPDLSHLGEHDVTIEVADGRGGVAVQRYTMAVKAPPGQIVTQSTDVDLRIGRIVASSLAFDRQTLAVHGDVSATVFNAGSSPTSHGFNVTFFEDLNGNQVFDANVDNPLGSTRVRSQLSGYEYRDVSASVSGKVQFAETLIYAFVDSGNELDETNELNNVAAELCDLAPVLEWSWTASEVEPEMLDVVSTPAVIDINQDGTPDIVFVTTNENLGTNDMPGILRAVDGATGNELFTVTDPSLRVNAPSSIAVADIDLDGLPEIVAQAAIDYDVPYPLAVLIFENDGTPKYGGRIGMERHPNGGITIANIDDDPAPEIIAGQNVLKNDGTLLWTFNGGIGAAGFGDLGGIPIVADLDLDGTVEILAGNTLYDNLGNILWYAHRTDGSIVPDGYAAIGNFDDDDFGEYVLATVEGVYLIDSDGAVIWGPKDTHGGPPVVADFNADGRAEIGLATYDHYIVLDADGNELWRETTQDHSSSESSSAVFDFDGDGRLEIVYRDEVFLRIFDGTTGELRADPIAQSSCTWFEYPLVVDVDGDGSAEIVSFANSPDNCTKPEQGIYVFKNASDAWVDTREIWNQHGYYVTNINDDGSVPAVQEPSWLGQNTFHGNTLVEADESAGADLVPSYVRYEVNDTGTSVTVRVGNGGANSAPDGVDMAFYDGHPDDGGRLLGVVQTSRRLDPGTFEDVTFVLPDGEALDLWIVADDDGAGIGHVHECDEQNNAYHPQLVAGNSTPVFTTLPVLSTKEGGRFEYKPLAQDDDGDALQYRLDFGPDGMEMIDGTVAWEPSSTDAGIHPVHVVVDDGHGGRAVQVFEINVTEASNNPPRITSIPAATTIPYGEIYTYEVKAEDLDSEPLVYSLALSPENMRIEPDFGTIEWLPTSTQLGKHNVVIYATDSAGGTDVQTIVLEVVEPDFAPVFLSVPPTRARVNSTVEYLIQVVDPNGNAVELFVDGPNTSLDGNLLTWAPTAPMNRQEILISAKDGNQWGFQTFFVSAVEGEAENSSPVITSSAPTTVRLGASYNYRVVATDADNDALTYSLETKPVGMEIDGQGVIRWPSPPLDFTTEHVTVRVDDGFGGIAVEDFDVSLVPLSSNTPPTIVSSPKPLTLAGTSYEYQLRAVDAENDGVAWKLETAPFGATLDSINGLLRWTPGLEHVGENTFVVSAIDARGGLSQQRFHVEVNCVNSVPQITSTPPTLALTGDTYSYAVRAFDPDGDTLTFTIASTPEASFEVTESGLVTWTDVPNDLVGASVNVRVTATDGTGAAATQQYTIVVFDGGADGQGNRMPTITSVPGTLARVGERYTYSIVAEDGDGDQITFDFATSANGAPIRPDGMTIADPFVGSISWTPDAGQIGENEVIITVTDGKAISTQGFTIRVSENHPPVIALEPESARSVTAGATYRYTVRAEDPDGDRLQYQLVSNPDGMTIDRNNGRIVWNSPAELTEAVPIEIRVTDIHGAFDSQSLTITPQPDTEPPVVYVTVQTGRFVSGSDADVDLGANAIFHVRASDNVGIGSISLTVGGMQIPLDGSGKGSSVLDTLGEFDVVATATDTNGLEAVPREFKLTVVPPGHGHTPVFQDPPSTPFDPADTEPPFLEIISPTLNSTVTDRVPIIGTVDDPASPNAADGRLWYWQVLTARLDRVDPQTLDLSDPDLIVLAQGTEEVINGELGFFDPAQLSNDPYLILLVAYDDNGQGWVEPTIVNVEGNVQLGNFRLDFTDLSLPLAGIPVEVTRVYDTLSAQDEGDFGYGWTMGVQDARILETIPPGYGFTPYVVDQEGSSREGATKVYLTNPSGQRIGFTFAVRTTDCSSFGAFGLNVAGVCKVHFLPDPGVYDKLSVEGEFGFGDTLDALGGTTYNPDVYTLETADGTKYVYDEDDGLQSITDLNGNVITFDSTGIRYNDRPAVAFTRDHRDRIRSIQPLNIDSGTPVGSALTYEYDLSGDLREFTDAAGIVTRYGYFGDDETCGFSADQLQAPNDAPAHYLKCVSVAGAPSISVEFDLETGELLAVRDALGQPIDTRSYDNEAHKAVIQDGNGNVTTLIYDDRGNIVQERDPLYTGPEVNDTQAYCVGEGSLPHMTLYCYSDPDNPDLETLVVDGMGNKTRREYDDRGNLLTITEYGNALAPVVPPAVTRFTYDSGNRVTSITNARNYVTTFTYDVKGNLASITNADGKSASFTYYDDGR
ncbi:MAG: hypothetical protein KDB23_08095, partial [Planctomycetales bacterium]|nr:hypothetical protein [Planctomycetales bacterium]